MEVYRIVKDRYKSSALNGRGAALYGGRWNFVDIPTVYCAESRALATLETFVHTGRLKAMPSDLILLTISIPDAGLSTLKLEDCPVGWDKSPVVFSSQRVFTDFYKSEENLALSVPSVVIPEEHNILLNPKHKLMSKVKVVGERKLEWDARF